MSELKRCPFCGAEPMLKEINNTDGKIWYSIICINEKCRINPSTDYHTCKAVVVREWNRRAEDE